MMEEIGCTCPVVDEQYWTRYGDAVEPGSMYEWNPECPVHGEKATADTAEPPIQGDGLGGSTSSTFRTKD